MEFVEYLPLLHLQLYVEKELSFQHHHSTPIHFIYGERHPHHQEFRQDQTYHHHHSHFIGDNYSDNYADHGITGNSTIFPHSKDDVDNSQVKVDPTTAVIDQLPLRLPLWGIVLLVVLYSATFLLGVVGNFCVIFIVSHFRRMRTVTNYFIVNLAIADLFVLIFCLLPNLISNIFVPWVLGEFLCKTVPYIQGVSVCASIYFLVAISLERCIAIGWPLKYYITKEKAKLIICAIWVFSLGLALPWGLTFDLTIDKENPHLEFCIESWPDSEVDWQNYYFLIGNLFLCYVLPLGMILVCYLTIWFRVYRRPVPSDSYHKAIELIHQRSKAAVVKMFIVVVLIFALSWLPLYAIIIRVKFGSEVMSDLEATMISFVYPIAQWLLCFNSSINPIVYSFLNTKFRKAFTGIFYGYDRKSRVQFKHKSPTVNILLKRFNTYRVETTMSNNNDHEYSSDSI